MEETKTSFVNARYWKNAFIIAISCLMAISFLGAIFELGSLVSFAFALSFILVFVRYFLKVIFEKKISANLLFLIAMVVLGTMAGTGITFEFDLMKKSIIILSIIFIFKIGSEDKISKKARHFITIIFLAVALITIYMYNFGGLNEVYYGTTEFISLNFTNSNEAALWLCAIFVLLFSVAFTYKNWFVKIGIIVVSALIFPIIEATGSRNAFLACIVCVVGVLLIAILRAKKLPKFVLLTFVWLPIVFFFIYMYIVIPNLDRFEEIFSFLMEGGKTLETREDVWQKFVDDIGSWWALGNYGYYQGEQMHNSALTILGMYGILFSVGFFHYMYKSLVTIQQKQGVLSAFALCAILFTGNFEASIFAGSVGLYLIALILPCLLGKDEENEDDDEDSDEPSDEDDKAPKEDDKENDNSENEEEKTVEKDEKETPCDTEDENGQEKPQQSELSSEEIEEAKEG